MNLGIMNETSDPSGMLAWLENELSMAENEERVILIAGHIAPGAYSCTPQWAHRYNALVERYQHIIRMSVYGHDHRELFEIARAKESQKPIAVNMIAGSLGTYL